MTKRPTKNPKPIGQHPHAGQYAVGIWFRTTEPDYHRDFRSELERWFVGVADLDIAVREIGAAGEASEHEIWPPFGPLAHTEDDIDTIRTTRDQNNVETRGRT